MNSYSIAWTLTTVAFALAAGNRGELLTVRASRQADPAADVRHIVETAAARHDVDDPAIWVHPADPARSLILGTVKVGAPAGALMAYDLAGRIVQTIAGLDRPNNVDVEYGFVLGGRAIDVVAITERRQQRLRLFRIDPDGPRLVAVGTVPVLDGEQGPFGDPMGIGLYRRPADGAVFAIVSPKAGGRRNYLWQYRLADDGAGRVKATLVRRLGHFSGGEEIEAVAVDDALGFVYFADESSGIRKWHADPDHQDAGTELAHFGREGFRGDREGIGIYALAGGNGYIVCTDQLQDRSEYRLYRREGEPGRPHDHDATVKVVRGTGDSTDGIEVTSTALGSMFPHGVLVTMNSSGRNFLIFSWDEIARRGATPLRPAPPPSVVAR
jgi:3-phytase